MFGQLIGYEVAVDAEAGHLAEREYGTFTASCEVEDVFHALHWGVDCS